MSDDGKETVATEGGRPKGRRSRIRMRIAWVVGGVVALAMVATPAVGTDHFTGPLFKHLTLGWGMHLQRLGTSIHWEPGTIVLSLLALAGGGVLVHLLAERFAVCGGKKAPGLGTTAKVIAMVLCCCAGAIATSGVLHQLAWLSQKPVRVNLGRAESRTEMLNRMKIVLNELEEYSAAKGEMPRYLADLAKAKPECRKYLSAATTRDGDSVEPFIYLRQDGPMDNLNPSTVVLVGRQPGMDLLCLGRADLSVSVKARGAVEKEYPQCRFPVDTP